MISKDVRFIVIAEVIVCFVPLAVMLFVGFLFAPFAVDEMLEGRIGGGLMPLLAVACGVAGFIALVQVLKWLFGRQTDLLGRRWTLALMLLGLLPVAVLFVGAVFGGEWDVMLAWAAPILVTAHIAYLARQYLFNSTESRVNLPSKEQL